MYEVTLEVLIYFIPICIALGFVDRVRGDQFELLGSAAFEKILYGYLISLLFGHFFSPLVIGIVLAHYIGESPGWGNVLGPALQGVKPRESDGEGLFGKVWQKGYLLEHVWVALAFRGFIWGILFIPLSFADIRLLAVPIAYTIAMPFAVYLTNKQQAPAIGNWEHQEYFRGWLVGPLIIAFSYLLHSVETYFT